MDERLKLYTKAKSLIEVDNAVRFDVPITPDHEFYTDFSDVRGDFEDKMLYKTLNVNSKTFVFNRAVNRGNKVTLFLAGMRGSGKTSELEKIAKKLHNKDCFFCVTCNLDDGLDMNDLEYMDILIFQLERLFQELEKHKIDIDKDIIGVLQSWFGERVKEVNKVIKKEGGFEVEVEAKSPSFFSFLSIAAKLKANISGSKENADKIRTVFRSNFTDFSKKTNEFIEYVNIVLREKGIAQEILFIIDGLEKSATVDIRRKIILEGSERIRQIKAHTIFALPIEQMALRRKLEEFATVTSFPFVKIVEKDGTIIEEAVSRFNDFVYKRIESSLFDNPATVRKAILLGGGSPRELLRLLEYANIYADEDENVITIKDLDKGIKKLAAQSSQYLRTVDLTNLKTLKENNDAGKETPFDDKWQDLLEDLIVLEYNDGTYKRVNPIVAESAIYKQYVG
ncbi:MAG: hypothetical protein U5L45_12260 [Saprospiraceae bacterium]|nr:hypothetical protein [Saprospiraceae bacterium]